MISDTRLFLKIDESGSAGKKVKGKTHYVMAGCLIKDNEAFEHITARYGLDVELKFHDQPMLRDEILMDAEPLVLAVFYVQFSKRKHKWTGKGDKSRLHENMLHSLTKGIVDRIVVDDLDVVIDHTSLIPDERARAIVRDVCSKAGIRANPVVADSISDYGLQTNDFFTGSIGYWFNTPADESADPAPSHYVGFFDYKLIEVPYRETIGGRE